MIRATHLCPLIEVFDMPTSLRFYRDRLGFIVVEASGEGDDVDWCWLKLDGADLMLNTAYERDARPAEPDPARIAAHGDTGLFLRCPDVDQAWAHVSEQGIEADPPLDAPYGMRQLYLTDPDGYRLCFQCPVRAEEAGPAA